MELFIDATHREPDSAVVTVGGELDVFSAGRLEAVITPLVTEGRVHLVIDAVRLRFCDLAGVRLLERVHDDAAAAAGGLIVWASRPLGRLLSLLWPEGLPGRPTVVRAAPAVPSPGPQLVLLRGSSLDLLPPAPGTDAASTRTPAAADRERRAALLDQSRRLRAEAAARREILCERAQSLCANLAAAHERLAAIHLALRDRRSDVLACDGVAHRRKAAHVRRQAEVFSRR
ncbi:STAS domain-containing protein [Microbispora amethystogenes]|uniref:STAS domain-containing protein n=1 Tax=Microbispora amethystogenes TaxID=1427754 RepID=A0ABQ4FPA9_9ACTN|nr:STAS domain-containing protein [Microbispora amethystogenes]GIH36641.1 hypothetical protein Mam01_68050 [Microbispora amethystogenes]